MKVVFSDESICIGQGDNAGFFLSGAVQMKQDDCLEKTDPPPTKSFMIVSFY